MDSKLPPHIVEEMKRLRMYFPFRIIFGAVRGTECDCRAVVDMRVPNKLARAGWHVEVLKSA
jgi:hypothetical protein